MLSLPKPPTLNSAHLWKTDTAKASMPASETHSLNSEIFYTLQAAQIIIEQWGIHYNTIKPHSALGCYPPTPESIIPIDQRPIMH